MRINTIIKLIKLLKIIKESGLTIPEYCKQTGESASYIYSRMTKIKKHLETGGELFHEAVSLYNEIAGKRSFKEIKYSEEITELEDFKESDELASVTIIRSTNKFLENEPDKGIIIGYKICCKVRDSKDFITTLSREDAEQVFGLYTYYGGNVTARNVANEFPKYTLSEVKKIFRAFKLTKDSAWFPPHLLEEMTEEELAQYRLNLKERAAFKYADSRREYDYNQQIKSLTARINQYESFERFLIRLDNKVYPKPTQKEALQIAVCHDTVILYMSDMHIGAKVESDSIFKNEYNIEEVYKRIDIIVDELKKLGGIQKLVIANLGDSIDGFDETTSRRSHTMPQNMGNMEQASKFVDSMMYLFQRLNEEQVAVRYSYVAVKCGNHPGTVEWVLNQLIASKLRETYGDIETKVGETMFVDYNIHDNLFLMCHGRDEKHMKSHYPLNLDNKTENLLTDYLYHNYKLSPTTKIHIVSGDLHNESMNRGKFFKYWKVGSFFGSSDYCMVNYGNTLPHVNYHIINNNNVLFGTIELV